MRTKKRFIYAILLVLVSQFTACFETSNNNVGNPILSLLNSKSSEIVNEHNEQLMSEEPPEPPPPYPIPPESEPIYWNRMQDFPGWGRRNAVAFSINGKGYIAAGETTWGSWLSDLWEYDSQTSSWTQKADIPYPLGYDHAVGFAINGKGYYGTGINTNSISKNWQEYNPNTNQWVSKKNFPGVARFGAVAFAIGNKGYLGTGTTGYGVAGTPRKDFWEYNPATDSWRQVADLPGVGRCYATSFVIGNYGYVGTGSPDGLTNSLLSDFWRYLPAANGPGTWVQIPSLPARKLSAMGFGISGRGVVGGGYPNAGGYPADLWSYQPGYTSWTREPDLESVQGMYQTTFTIGQNAFAVVGKHVYKFYKSSEGL
nr:kelch repeat-containing protein [Leptospira weilii]